MNFGYYFWDNFKKTGYAHGKLVKGLYKTKVEEGETDAKTFIKEQTLSVLESEKEKTNHQISLIEDKLKILNNNYGEKINLKNAKVNKTKEVYNEKIDTLKKEKVRIEEAYKIYSMDASVRVAEKMRDIGDKLGNMENDIGEYEKQSGDFIEKQVNKIHESWLTMIKGIKSTITGINQEIQKGKKESEKDKKLIAKNRGLLLILILLCAFDVVAGYLTLSDLYPGRYILVGFIAAVFVAIGMILIYFSGKELEKKGIRKQIGILCLLMVVVLFGLYIVGSLSVEERETIDNFSLKSLSTLAYNPMFILRALILPALFVGDAIIKAIDWDVIVGDFRLNKGIRKIFEYVTYIIKGHSLSKYLKKEKKEYMSVLNELKEQEIPGSIKIKNEVNDIKGTMRPLLDEITNKKIECDNRLKEIDAKLTIYKNEEIAELKNIDNEFDGDLKNIQSAINREESTIHLLKEEIGKAEISVREGIGLGLIS